MIGQRGIGKLCLLAVLVLASIVLWRMVNEHTHGRVAVVRRPASVMGTDGTLVAIVERYEVTRASEALEQAEQLLRRLESQLSNWRDDSEISRLQQAAPGVEHALSVEAMHVLKTAATAFEKTDGAFDITCRPQVELWTHAEQQGRVPSDAQLAEARAASNWSLIELRNSCVVKREKTVCVDLGGIAKGYAIDRALDVIRQAGCDGGMVEVGGDLACFGRQADGQPWPVDVRHPSSDGSFLRLRVMDAAVATSGDYARFLEIQGKHYSHIIDPRYARPAEAAQSVTVVARDAITADIWATALSVLGPDGLSLLPGGVDALLVIADRPGSQRIVCTPGVEALIDQEMVQPFRSLEVVQ